MKQCLNSHQEKPGQTEFYSGLGRGKMYQLEKLGLVRAASLRPRVAVRIFERLEAGIPAGRDMPEMNLQIISAVGEAGLCAGGDVPDWRWPREAKLREPEGPPQKRKEQHGRPSAAGAPFITEHQERSAELESKINRELHDVVGKALPPLERVRLLDLLTELNCLAHRMAMNDNQTQARTSRKIRQKEQKELHHPGAEPPERPLALNS